MIVHRQPHRLLPDPARVVARPFIPADEARVRRIAARVLALPEPQVERVLAEVLERFAHRHRHFEQRLLAHYELVAPHLPASGSLSHARRLLLGSYFTHEYSVEAAALFNPSIVRHPDQSGLAAGEARVLLSFRATGEGHISSLEFRSGTLSAEGVLRYDPRSPFATLPQLNEQGEMCFSPDSDLSERVLFPMTADERGGIEDARWVRFEEGGAATYYGLYTAYDGTHIRPKLLATDDFLTFRVLPLRGAAVQNKGFALFPRRIQGRYAMLSRQDNENNFIMFSDEVDRWEQSTLLRGPAAPHEFVQIGNNGSPVETDAGWLVLTHGVGPMRTYALGVDLLDLDDPTTIVASLSQPLLAPDESEREGYVPNVLYSCGALLHNGRLVIPYALSDSASAVATVALSDLLDALLSPAFPHDGSGFASSDQ